MANWKEYKLSELLEKVIDNRGRTCPIDETGFPLIATNCIRNEKLYPDFVNVRYVSEETYNNWFRGHPEPGDLIFVLKGTPGRVCWTPNPVNFCIAQDMVALRANQKIVNPKYLFALLRSTIAQQRIGTLHVGSLIPHFKKGDFDKLMLPVLNNYELQVKIGNIYFDFCDKIELNNQINQELGALAQVLFKQWFIDFEFPNEDGQPYKSSGGEMVESELGEIPRGWYTSIFHDHLDASRGLSYKGSGLTDATGGIPMVNLNSVYEGGGYKDEGLKFYSGEYKERHIIRPWDLAVTNTEQGHKYLLIGYPAFVPRQIGEEAIFSHHIYRVRTKEDSHLTNQFFYYLIMQPAIRDQIIGACNGTTVNMLKIDGLERPKFIVPPKSLVNIFSEIAGSIWENKELAHTETQELINLRDTLLPKLISGELELRDTHTMKAF